MSEKTTQLDRKCLPADYQGTTPEEVALAVLRYRPGKKKRGSPKRTAPSDWGRKTETTVTRPRGRVS